MEMKITAATGIASTIGATVFGILPSVDQIDAAAKWPLVVILGAVCCFCVWIIYQQGCKFGERLDSLSDSIKGLTEELRQRPCIRRKEND